MTPEPIFWTPNLAAQPAPEAAPLEGNGIRTPVMSATLPSGSAMRTLEVPGSAAAVQAQAHALGNLLASLQAATQKGSNRCNKHPSSAWPYQTGCTSC